MGQILGQLPQLPCLGSPAMQWCSQWWGGGQEGAIVPNCLQGNLVENVKSVEKLVGGGVVLMWLVR